MSDLESMSGEALAAALQALAGGDFTVRLPADRGPQAEIARAFNRVAELNSRTGELLGRYESVTRELQRQQDRLREANERLELQTENQNKSELQLKRQQAKLRAANEELEGKAELLSEKMRQVERKNREVEQAKAALEERAEQLALSSRYKSDFLANMSHELRTPLNSLLILAKLLADNPAGNLSTRQVEYARTILAAGTDLLSLINDILDLAKVESGTMTLNIASEPFSDLHEYVERTFRQVAAGKTLAFEVSIAADLPPSMHTDAKRLRQILRNLLSNAFKFTDIGRVDLAIGGASSGWTAGHPLEESGEVVAFRVRDTGIGIAPDKQKIIFEEFQQADGTTSRQFGGTGLGLSISRELARLLGGEIHVDSLPGQGSTFTLYLPLVHEWMRAHAPTPTRSLVPAAKEGARLLEATGTLLADDRRAIQAGDRVVVIVERDVSIAAGRLDRVRNCGFKGLVVPDARAAAAMARDIAPNALVLRADKAGAESLALDNIELRVPVKMVLSDEGAACTSLALSWSSSKLPARPALVEALQELSRSSGRAVRTLLLAERDAGQSEAARALLREQDIDVATGSCALDVERLLQERRFDAVAIGQVDGMARGELLLELLASERSANTPLIIYGAESDATQDPSPACPTEIFTVKLFESLHDALCDLRSRLDEDERSPITKTEDSSHAKQGSAELAGKALIIDDDIRNIFALTAALENHGMNVIYAESAKSGIELLKQHPDTNVVLVDIMMPEIDGYETIRLIRGMESCRHLPIFAVTAKAMVGDREKCLEAGASDYLAKPVRMEQLLAMLHAWLDQ